MRTLSMVAGCLLLTLAFPPATVASEPITGPPLSEEERARLLAPADPYGGAYTADELAALDRALWGANLTRFDLNFDKDMAKGYGCFPIVREMMAEPLTIAQAIDELAAGARPSGPSSPRSTAIHAARMVWGEDAVMPYKDWAMSSQWEFELRQDDPLSWTAEALAQLAATDYGAAHATRWNSLEYDALRLKLPQLSTWHEIFEPPSDLTDARIEQIEAWIELQPQDWYMCLLVEDTYLGANGPVVDYLLKFAGAAEWARALPREFFPTAEPVILDTPVGAVVIGTYGDDVYRDRDCALVIDPGGNDTYINCRLGAVDNSGRRGAALFIDLGGDDFYDCSGVDFNFGAAILGYAAFYDLGGGNDRYYAGNVSLGAAIGGVATFYDDGGSDTYSGKVFTQGAAGFGIAVMCDDSVQPAPDVPSDEETPDPIDLAAFDNDSYTAWTMAQGFARTHGVAICANTRGNETYHAGGVYLHAPLFSDRYQSFSQGFAIGERNIDYAGGIALLADFDGNDRYLGDVYNQGVGYWYSAGFLYDGGGNDHYEMTQYGQGSGIHLAVGGLIDESGSDTYVMHSGLGQGSSHDYAASVFMDRGGDDRYLGNTTCNGSAVTNSVGLFFDRGGNDLYAARRGSLNYGGAARGFGSIGVLVDLGGEDDYLGPRHDDQQWLQTEFAVGLDVGPNVLAAMGRPPEQAEAESSGPTSGPDVLRADVKIPEIIGYSGPLTQEVFDELWEISIRWEVGDNRVIVPAARKRLIAFGLEVLPLVEAEMSDPNSLAVRAFDEVLKAFSFTESEGGAAVPAAAGETPAPPARTYLDTWPQIEVLLTRQLADASDDRKTAALRVIGDLKLEPMGAQVTGQIDHPDPAMQRRAIGVLGQIGSHAANAQMLALLTPETDEALLKVVIETVTALRLDDTDTMSRLAMFLADPRFAVRDTLRQRLAAEMDAYAAGLAFTFQMSVHDGFKISPESPKADRRALRTVMHVYLASDQPPLPGLLPALRHHLGSTTPELQVDAVLLAEHWGKLVAGTALEPDFYGEGGILQLAAAVRQQQAALIDQLPRP